MNRRDFLGGMAATAAVGQILKMPLPIGESVRSPLPRAKWLENGLIDAGGSHEPYIFVIRRGGERLDARKDYEWNQSEELIRTLHNQGIEVFHTHLYKGFGMAAEKPEMEDARRAAAIAHRYGMKVDSYIQWNTMMYETFFAEEPRAKDWIQRDVSGLPILLVYGFQQSYRYRPCFTHQEYLDYLKQIVRYAVDEVKTDFIHFDNFDLNAEPDSCHCPACVEGFRAFLRAKYTPEKRHERFGFENVDHVNPPQWNRQNRPEKMAIIFDPAIQEWIDFRCQVMADALRQMAEYVRSLNPDVAVEINPHGITGGNRAWENAIDHSRLLTSTDVFWTEEENPCVYLPDGRLISKIRSYKLARAYNNILLAYIEDSPVAMAESLAFNQTLGFAGSAPLPPAMLEHVAFYRKNRELFLGTTDVASAGVLRSYSSITYHHARAQLSAILVEQALIQSRIPFKLVFDETPPLNTLPTRGGESQPGAPLPNRGGESGVGEASKLQVLVLPDSECLSDEQLARIRSFVEQGGGLVAIGQAGLYDEWRRLRVEPGLKGLVDGQTRARDYEEEVQEAAASGHAQRKTFGKGRVVYVPAVEFDGPLPEAEPYFNISNRFWKRPRNWQELIAAIRWAANAELPFEVSGPDFLVANLVEQDTRQRRLLHLVNYDAAKTPALSALQCTVRIPGGNVVKEVKMYEVGGDSPRPIDFTPGPSSATFTVPELKTYAVLAVGW
jgi:glycosyl hydrolase family 42 (putative beta-galactosidase)